MKIKNKVFLTIFLMLVALSTQAGTVTFDPPPIIGGATVESSYQEGGVSFTGTFGHYSTAVSGSASNSSSGVMKLFNDGSMRIELNSPDPFRLTSVDLSEYSNVFVGPTSITFTGYYFGGGSISQSFITDGVFDGIGGVNDFETFLFNSQFNNLEYVDVNSIIFAMDNLSIHTVPLPAGAYLFLSGLMGLSGLKIRKQLKLPEILARFKL